MSLRVVPAHFDQAEAYVRAVHRHLAPPLRVRLAMAVADETDRIRGVAMAGRPVARHDQDGVTLEVLRVATDGAPDACSMLYRACWRAARAIGYCRLITFTRVDEPGTSLHAAGFVEVERSDPRVRGWDRPSRGRDEGELVGRRRWELRAPRHEPGEWPEAAVADDSALRLAL